MKNLERTRIYLCEARATFNFHFIAATFKQTKTFWNSRRRRGIFFIKIQESFFFLDMQKNYVQLCKT